MSTDDIRYIVALAVALVIACLMVRFAVTPGYGPRRHP